MKKIVILAMLVSAPAMATNKMQVAMMLERASVSLIVCDDYIRAEMAKQYAKAFAGDDYPIIESIVRLTYQDRYGLSKELHEDLGVCESASKLVDRVSGIRES